MRSEHFMCTKGHQTRWRVADPGKLVEQVLREVQGRECCKMFPWSGRAEREFEDSSVQFDKRI